MHGIQFTVIGVFKEKVTSFGLSELTGETVLIPITVIRYFAPVERIDPMYVQARRPEDVESLTLAVKNLLQSRHRPGAIYLVENLTAILDAAKNIALVLTIVLILISAIALIISGIGIMNIMLVTVTERTREIGIRMAVGASRSEVLRQFLFEAMLLSLSGGVVGILIGVAMPLSVQYFVEGSADSHIDHLHRGGLRRLLPGGAGVRAVARQPRRPLEPHRSVTLRVVWRLLMRKLGLAIILTACAAGAQVRTITLRDAVQLALQQNPDLALPAAEREEGQ